MSPLKKSVLQTGNLLFGMIGIIFLFILGNSLLKINTYGFESGVKSTAKHWRSFLSHWFHR